ncbi:MAG: hypothetical protein BWY76_02407 [bacterium ADurb.Bin429]|nr:MAG: hypothetical protein BWY76_02407 [bacterium ADurb.Bin429]
MQPVLSEFVQGIELGEAQTAETLVLMPLLSALPPGPDYLTLSEALAAGTLTITELHEGGTVPKLAAVNEGALPVLLLDGEEIIGAKQNRVLNTTILIREYAKTVLPVSCVEQGRWRYDTHEFHDSPNVMAPRMRARKQRSVSEHLAHSGERASDQGDVWESVAELAADASAPPSPTGAMRDVYAHAEDDITALVRAFHPLPDQRGMLVFIQGKPAGVEYISHARAFAKVFDKLLRGYALEALITRDKGNDDVTPAAAKTFLAAIEQSDITSYEAIGYGVEYRIVGKTIVGSALSLANAMIHVSLLAAQDSTGKRRTRREIIY